MNLGQYLTATTSCSTFTNNDGADFTETNGCCCTVRSNNLDHKYDGTGSGSRRTATTRTKMNASDPAIKLASNFPATNGYFTVTMIDDDDGFTGANDST